MFSMIGMLHTYDMHDSILNDKRLTRLFRPSNSDDASHDEALSSRIAALNMLDLTLDHLGVETGKNGDDVMRIVEACGESEFTYDIKTDWI